MRVAGSTKNSKRNSTNAPSQSQWRHVGGGGGAIGTGLSPGGRRRRGLGHVCPLLSSRADGRGLDCHAILGLAPLWPIISALSLGLAARANQRCAVWSRPTPWPGPPPFSSRRNRPGACPRSNAGSHRSASRQLRRRSSSPAPVPDGASRRHRRRQGPWSPATAGLETGRPRMSACSCMHNLLAVMPPSTFSAAELRAHRSCSMASRTSLGLVTDGFQRGPGQVRFGGGPGEPDDRPSGVGAPVGSEQAGKSGDEVDAPAILHAAARVSISAAAPIMPSWSRSHCTAAPVTAIEPSRA